LFGGHEATGGSYHYTTIPNRAAIMCWRCPDDIGDPVVDGASIVQ